MTVYIIEDTLSPLLCDIVVSELDLLTLIDRRRHSRVGVSSARKWRELPKDYG
jgi:hypothetical protein